MSNPLLRPNDSRFQQPDIRDAAGKNRFGDENPPNAVVPVVSDVYTASSSEDAQPFAAQFPVQQASRANLLMFLGGIAWGAAALGAFSFSGWFNIGWLAPLLGVGPGGAAWLLAHEELKAIRAGAISSAAERNARHAYWLGLTGIIACAAIVTAMVFHAMHLLPDL